MSRRAGSSLFEVLVAFAITALVLGALLPGQAAPLSRSQDGTERLLAQDHALSVLAGAGILWPVEPGTATKDARDWRVTRTIAPETIRGQPFHRIAVRVEDVAGRRLAEVETLRVAR